MAIKRQLWKPRFEVFPPWPCPACEIGTVVLVNDSLNIVETGLSKEAHDVDAWEPTWIDERFTAMLTRNNVKCGESVATCGRTRHVEDHNWERQKLNWTRLLEPKFFSEAPPVFPIPESCPDQIKQELKAAFSLMWSDVGSSANRLRSAIEVLLDERKVRKTTTNANGQRVYLTLHRRIRLFRKEYSDVASPLEAVKWLGNIGSHAKLDTLSIDELLSGFELFEHAIERVYVRREKHLWRLAGDISKQKRNRRKPG